MASRSPTSKAPAVRLGDAASASGDVYSARKLCKASFPELGLKFGGKDHTTVLSACRKIEALLDSDPQLRMVQEIERHLLA